LQCFQREFPQLAAVSPTTRVREQVASCDVAKRTIGETSWDETIIVSSRQLLETNSLGVGQEGQDDLENIGGLDAPRRVIVVDVYPFHLFLPSF
jgi:hypothetical protein